MADLTPQDWFETIAAMFTSPTRRPWEDRLTRPSRELAAGNHFTRYTTARNRYLDMLWSYNVGDPPLPAIEPEYRDAFLHVMRKARSNYAPMCIRAMLDRMELQAVSTPLDSDVNGDDVAADIMDQTGFVAVLKEIFEYAFSMGEAYAMVVPGTAGDTVLDNGVAVPSIHAIDPRRCIGVPDPLHPIRLAAAVVRHSDPIRGEELAYLFLPGEKWTLNFTSGSWGVADPVPEPVAGFDQLGGVPIVRFDNLNGLGEYEPHIDLLDRINDTTLQRIIGFWYQALRQRAIMGDDDEHDEDDPDLDGAVRDLGAELKAGPGALWRFPNDWTIWESQQTDFGPFINAKRDDVKEFAAVTATPLHLITPDAAGGSAEGAGLMRESLTSKVRDRRARFTPPLRLLWRIAFAMAGEAGRGRRMRLHWGPIEFRTLAEKASASSQAVGTLSTETRGTLIWDLTPDENDLNLQQLQAEQIVADSAVPLLPGNDISPG